MVISNSFKQRVLLSLLSVAFLFPNFCVAQSGFSIELGQSAIVTKMQPGYLTNSHTSYQFNSTAIGGTYRLRRNHFIFESNVSNSFMFENSGWSNSVSIHGAGYCQICYESRGDFGIFASSLELGSQVGFVFDAVDGFLNFGITAGAQFYAPYSAKLLRGEYYYHSTSWGQSNTTHNFLGDEDYEEPKIDERPFLIPNLKLMMGVTLAEKWSLAGLVGLNLRPFDVSLGLRLRYFVWETSKEKVD